MQFFGEGEGKGRSLWGRGGKGAHKGRPYKGAVRGQRSAGHGGTKRGHNEAKNGTK